MQTSRSRLIPALGLALIVANFAVISGSAGSQEDPEITDAAGDHKLAGGAPDPDNVFLSADILAAWVAEETDATFTLMVQAAQEIRGGSSNGQTTTHYTYSVSGVVGETAFLAGARIVGNPPEVTPIGDAAEASAAADILTLVVAKSTFEGVAPGTILGDLYASSSVQMQGSGPILASDRAPDADFGRAYVFSPAAATGDVNDTDADLLNDTWEQEHFGNLTYNGTDDPDADGCDNACEFAAGTDPNVADTDGDGISDGDEIAAGGDPLDPSDGTTDTGNMTTDDSDGNTTDAPPESSDGDDGNKTASADEGSSIDEAADDGKDSPGVGLAALLACLAAVAFTRRRR